MWTRAVAGFGKRTVWLSTRLVEFRKMVRCKVNVRLLNLGASAPLHADHVHEVRIGNEQGGEGCHVVTIQASNREAIRATTLVDRVMVQDRF
jgi:hypothetical protein